MNRVVPWFDLVVQIIPSVLEGKRNRPPFPVESLQPIHFRQQLFTLIASTEKALHDTPLFR